MRSIVFSAKKLSAVRQSRSLGNFESLEYRCLLAGDLIAAWNADDLRLDHADGATIPEWLDSKSSILATATGLPTLQTDELSDRAVLRFDPSDGADYFFVDANTSPLSNANDFSVAVVFQTRSADLVGSNGLWYENTGLVDGNQLGFGKDWGLTINQVGQLSTGMSGGFGTPAESIYSSPDWNDGFRHTAVVTRSGSNLSLYVDDFPVVVTNAANATARSSLDLAFGALTSGQNPFTGDIFQIQFYDGALSSSEVANLQDELNSYYTNQRPIANADTYLTVEDAVLFFVPAPNGVLANDTDPDGDSLTATLLTTTRHGDLTFNPDGSFVYDSENNFFGQDSFTYQAVDFRGSEPVTVTINVQAVYDGVTSADDAYKLVPGETLTVNAQNGVLANDANPDLADLTVQLASDVTGGQLQLNADGSFQYDPQAFTGLATFQYQVNDGTRLTSPVTVTLAVNTPPTAVADEYAGLEDQTLMISAADGLLANDIDAQSDNTLSVVLLSEPALGTLTVNADGSFEYIPVAEFSGPVEFSYLTTDGFDDSNPTTVRLQIDAVNDLPATQADAYFLPVDLALSVPVGRGLLANDADIDSTELLVEMVTSPALGTVQLNADGSFSYASNQAGPHADAFTYRVFDGQDYSAPETVSITVADRPLVISEFMAANPSLLATRIRLAPEDRFRDARTPHEWIEIQNRLDADIDVGGLYLSDDVNNTTRWQFPDGTIIPAGGYLVVLASGENITDTRLDELELLHTNFGLSLEGEFLGLSYYDGTVIDSYGDAYPVQTP
ncbi:MAG: tandem-95 repeat protein, partial [Planctomycetales bacterium]|nr:tandem-95 repeat protein [Planctomycetales bacterium]